MSKSKEQCNTIISRNFAGKEEIKSLLNAIEQSIKEICSAEFVLIWQYNKESNSLKILNKDKVSILKVNNSLMKQVLLKKEGFFDNHVASHRDFNEILDNPLKIQIKSLLIFPILDKEKNIHGVLTAYNSLSYGKNFQRYDLRCLGLLNRYALKITTINSSNTTIVKKKKPIDVESKKMTRAKLEEKLLVERKKVEHLEQKLEEKKKQIEELKEKLLEKTKELKVKNKVYEVEFVEEISSVDSSKKSDIQTIFDFLTKEVTYFANEEHMIYLFLEIIRNSLHHKEQLHFINEKLKKKGFINSLINELCIQKKLVLQKEEFNPTHSIARVAHLYTSVLSSRGITFNIFIDPHLPLLINADIHRIKSIIIHLMNNISGLVSQNGLVELYVKFLREINSLEIDIKGIKEQEKSGFFSTSKFNHSVVTSETGLGLSISSNLANLLGGKLKLTTIGLDEHSFVVELPIEIIKNNNVVFYQKNPIKIAIIAQEENKNSLNLLQNYLLSFGINKTNIVIVKNYKDIKNINFSHLFCFENMLSKKVDLDNFNSVTIFKFLDEDIRKKYNIKQPINEIVSNSYYGLELQKILFPHIEIEDTIEGTLVKKESILTKLKRLYF